MELYFITFLFYLLRRQSTKKKAYTATSSPLPMLSLQILAAATCPTGQTAAPSNISSFMCVWSTERTPSAFDCPALCAADGGVGLSAKDVFVTID